MAGPYRFERIRNVDQGNNGSDNENNGAERLLNLNWCLCGRCEVRETAREFVCCVEEPESENKLERGQLCQPVSGYDEFLFYFCFCFCNLR